MRTTRSRPAAAARLGALALALAAACVDEAPPNLVPPARRPETARPATTSPPPSTSDASSAPTQPTPPVAQSAPAAGPTTSRSETPAPSPAPPQPTPPAAAPRPAVPVRAARALEPSGTVALAGADSVVDPAARFEVEVAAPLGDAVLVLVDAQDAHVPSTATREVAGGATRLALAPTAPLTPASRYVLRVEGASTREAHDASGRAFVPATFALVVAGDPPPPPARPKKKPRR